MPKNDLVRGIDISAATAAFSATGGGSTGLGGLEIHDLDGPWHSGTLPWADIDTAGSDLADLATRAHSSLTGIGANDHHNQSHVLATTSGLGADHTTSGLTSGYVLRASGATTAAFAAIQDTDLPATIVRTSRQINSGAGLTGGGNLGADLTLNVGAGTLITVGADDVGITAGSAYQYIGTGSGTAAAWQDLSGLAGAGLAHATGALAVGAGAGITVNTNDVALTTPGTLTVATANAAAGSHTHAITSSSNPGGNAILLASTASGGLTLQSLAVQGSVDITNGGDLTVGANILFVDVSQVSVGINGAPDPQFALDVYGPARAEYWIGPHALQIKNALLISHFDGRQPFETNFTGETNGHMGQVAAVAGGVIWREGKFNKAVQVAEATTNFVVNPSFETNLTSWTLNNASGTCSAAQTALYSHSGTYSVRLASTTNGANDFYSINVGSLSASTAYTISAWVYAVDFDGGAIGNYGIYAYDTLDQPGTLQSTTITAATTGWVRHSVTVTTTATGGSHTIQLRLYAPNGYTAWDSVQLEQKAYATPYCDGSLGGYSAGGVANGTGHAWSGTAHASTSSRLAANLNYPTSGSLGLFTGTIAAWINLAALSTSNMHVLRATGTSAGNILLRVTTGGVLQGYWGTAAATDATVLSTGTWHHVAMTYDGATVRLYVNGQAGATGASSGFSGMPTLMYAGNTAGSGQLNGLLDDLLITSDCKVADELLAIYESNAPVFAETAKYGFRTTSAGLIWADDEGLWGRNVLGQPIIGLYGGEAATKSWAGLTLSSGDLVIGDNSRDAYLFWDDSAESLVVRGNIEMFDGASVTGTINATDGVLFKPGTTIAQSTGVSWVNDTYSELFGMYAAINNAATYRNTLQIGHLTAAYSGSTEVKLLSHLTGNVSRVKTQAISGTSDAYLIVQAEHGSPSSATLYSSGNTIITGLSAVSFVGGAANFDMPVTINDDGDAANDFRAESDTEANMIFLDASADLVYIGGSTNGLKIEKAGVVSFIGTGKIKDGTNIPLDTTIGTKIGTGTTQKLGFWNATPIIRPSAFTQTYSTASKTHSNLTYSAPAAYGAGANGYSTGAMAAAVHAAVIALAADVANVKQVLNSVIDDLQSMGLLA